MFVQNFMKLIATVYELLCPQSTMLKRYCRSLLWTVTTKYLASFLSVIPVTQTRKTDEDLAGNIQRRPSRYGAYLDGRKKICQRQTEMKKARHPMFRQELKELRSKEGRSTWLVLHGMTLPSLQCAQIFDRLYRNRLYRDFIKVKFASTELSFLQESSSLTQYLHDAVYLWII